MSVTLGWRLAERSWIKASFELIADFISPGPCFKEGGAGQFQSR